MLCSCKWKKKKKIITKKKKKVATKATIKSLDPIQTANTGTQLMFCNTYHCEVFQSEEKKKLKINYLVGLSWI